jgi:diguanylate cyclase (GGDEF)-like protein
MFLMLLAATLLPMAVFVWLGYRLLGQEAVHRLESRVADENRQFATLVHQRLTAARAVLMAVAETAAHRAPGSEPAGAGEVLLALARSTAQGKWVAGSQETLNRWKAARARSPETDHGAHLVWWTPDGEAAVARVVIRHLAVDGSVWLAEVDPGFLWAAALDRSRDFRHCVTDDADRPVHCAEPALVAVRQAGAAEGAVPAIRRELSLQADFGGGRWLFATAADPGLEPQLDSPLLLRWTLVGVGFTLLLAAGMSWLQFRRTAASLNSLIDGTQRLAEQDWSARVNLPSGDEFGRLAGSINRMAERIGHQMQAIQVQSAIDREILGGLDTARVMSLVARRLTALVPHAHVAVIAVGDGRQEWRAYRADGAPAMPLPAADVPTVPDSEFACWTRGPAGVPPWASRALGLPPAAVKSACWVPAQRQGQLLALLVMGADQELQLSEEARREIGELRDRTAVTLAAAARENALLERAVLDGLTGLLNRNGLHDAIDRLLDGRVHFTLVLVDLDRFKEVNDSLGHQAGDELLCAVAGRLRRCVSNEAFIARPGGDEFVLLLPGDSSEATAAALAICTELAKPFALRGVRQQIGGSVGLAAYPQHGHSRVELMRRADMAMYRAKSEGRGRLSWYESSLDERIAQRAWMAQELRKALDLTQFLLNYQPRVDAVSGRIVCAEVLLRWCHPERGMMNPTEFVAAAEETGLIDRIGHWVMAAAFRQMSLWRARGLPLKRIAVNVSPRQLRVPGFADAVLDMLARHQLTGTDVELELTENLFAGDVDSVIHALAPLRNAGILVALDDFGTGYSSLSSLYRLPVDVIKIDRSFVSDLGQRPGADAVARSIVALAKALRKRVVAEGVETRAQRDHLLRLDCDELQGFLYAQPMPADELEACLRGAQEPAHARVAVA